MVSPTLAAAGTGSMAHPLGTTQVTGDDRAGESDDRRQCQHCYRWNAHRPVPPTSVKSSIIPSQND